MIEKKDKNRKTKRERFRSRKGILFTLISIVLLVLMLSELVAYVSLNVSYNNIVNSGLYNAGVSDLIQSIRSNINPFLSTALQYQLSIIALNSSLNGGLGTFAAPFIQSSSSKSLFSGSLLFSDSYAFDDPINSIINSNQYIRNVGVTLTNSSIKIYQTLPFYMNITLTGLLNAISSQGSISYPIKSQSSLYLNGTRDQQAANQAYFLYTAAYPYSSPFINFVQSNITISSHSSPVPLLIGGVHATYGSTSPYMFASGYAYVLAGTPSCSSISSSFQNANYILVTTSGADISQNICGMGGVVTYTLNSVTPLKPYLVYSSSSNIVGITSNNMNVIVAGEELAFLNDSFTNNAIAKGYSFGSQYAPSYIDRAESLFNDRSPAGIYTFTLLNRQVASFGPPTMSFLLGKGCTPKICGQFTIFPFSDFQWVYPLNYTSTGGNQIISSLDGDTPFNGLYALGLSSTGNLMVYNGISFLTSNLIVPLNKWSFVGLELNSTSARVYLNLQNQTLKTPTFMVPNTITYINFTLGYRNSSEKSIFNGSISDWQVYNGLLPTQAQIQFLYQEGVSAPPLPMIPNINTFIVGWFPLVGEFNTYPDTFGYNYAGEIFNQVIFPAIYDQGEGLHVMEGISNPSLTSLSNYTGDPISQGSFQSYYTNLIQGVNNCNSISQCSNSSAQHLYLSKSSLDNVVNSRTVASFNGRNSIINGSAPYIFPITSMQWIYPTKYVTSGNEIISSFDGPSSNLGTYRLLLSSTGNLMVYNGISFLTSNLIVPLNQWSMVGFELNTTSTRAYLNNLSVTYSQTSPSSSSSNTFWTLGWSSGYTNYFNGSISNVQLYNSILSQSQLQTMYIEGISGYPAQTSNLSAWWQLDSNTKLSFGNAGSNGYPIDIGFINSNQTIGNAAGGFSEVPDALQFTGQYSASVASQSTIGNYYDGNNQLTASAWVFLTKNTKGPIIGFATSFTTCGGGTSAPFISSNGLTVYGWGGSIGNTLSSTVPSSGWYNLAITYNPSGPTETLYVDANSVNSITLSSYSGTSASNAYLTTCISGSRPTGVPINFTGSITDIQLYKSALSQSQITQLYLNDSVIAAGPSDAWQLSGGLTGLVNQTPDSVNTINIIAFYKNGKICTNNQFISMSCGLLYSPP